MIVYFSGTGNSRYAASLLADRLGDELLDAGDWMKEGKRAVLTSDKPWVFVAPTYAWQLPRVFEAFLRQGIFAGSSEAWFVMTCGDDIGNPEKELKDLCHVMGLNFHGVLGVVMPENYITLFKAPDKGEAEQIIRAAHPVLEEGARLIRQGKPFPGTKRGLLNWIKSIPVNRAFYPMFVKDKAFFATDGCNGCGLCETLCPLNNIAMEDKRPLWKGNCTQCMACICGCPKESIEYGRRSRGKTRYWCPEYKA